jgi:hypothetical protein
LYLCYQDASRSNSSSGSVARSSSNGRRAGSQQQQSAAALRAVAEQLLLSIGVSISPETLLQLKVDAGTQLASFAGRFKPACKVLASRVCTQVGASSSSSSSNCSSSSSSTAVAPTGNEQEQQQRRQQQQQVQPAWLLPLLLTCIEVTASWPQETLALREDPRLEMLVACADLIIASIIATPEDVDMALREKLLLPVLHKLGAAVLAVGQAAGAKDLSKYCKLLEVLLGKGEQGVCTLLLARRALDNMFVLVCVQLLWQVW